MACDNVPAIGITLDAPGLGPLEFPLVAAALGVAPDVPDLIAAIAVHFGKWDAPVLQYQIVGNWRWRPILGSSSTYITPVSPKPSCAAKRMRCNSPPESVFTVRSKLI